MDCRAETTAHESGRTKGSCCEGRNGEQRSTVVIRKDGEQRQVPVSKCRASHGDGRDDAKGCGIATEEKEGAMEHCARDTGDTGHGAKRQGQKGESRALVASCTMRCPMANVPSQELTAVVPPGLSHLRATFAWAAGRGLEWSSWARDRGQLVPWAGGRVASWGTPVRAGTSTEYSYAVVVRSTTY